MNRVKLAAFAGAFLLAAIGLSVAQTIILPAVSVINPTDAIQIVPLGQPGVPNKYATPAQITSQSGYFKVAPLTGFNYTFGNSQSYMAFAPAGTLAAGYVTFAPAPSDGARECIFSTAAITNLYLTANTSQTLNNAATSLSANSGACYLYGASNATWDRD